MATSTLKCTQCGHENEAERIYCHNCGTKLDRSVLPTTEAAKESPQAASKRVKKLANPGASLFAGSLKSLVTALFWAVVIAALVQIVRPPEGIPPMPSKDDVSIAPPILMAIQSAQTSQAAQRISINEPQINQYLQGTLKPQATGLIGDEVKFERAYVHCEDGVLWIWSQQSLFNYSLYASVGYRLSMENNAVKAKAAGGYLGHLPLHPLVMEYGDIIFSKLWTALRHEHKAIDAMESIEVKKGQIIVVTKPSK